MLGFRVNTQLAIGVEKDLWPNINIREYSQPAAVPARLDTQFRYGCVCSLKILQASLINKGNADAEDYHKHINPQAQRYAPGRRDQNAEEW